MAPPLIELADSQNKFEDLSGVNSSAYSNPYDALIEACEDNSVKKNVSWSFPAFSIAKAFVSFRRSMVCYSSAEIC
jgi:hypothetical protein